MSHKSRKSYSKSKPRKRGKNMARKKKMHPSSSGKKEKKVESYIVDDENLSSFSAQLSKIGLQLRDVPGDGNCLFRALADQLEGNCNQHVVHRQQVAAFMNAHRQDFEPFIEDNVSFDHYVNNLNKPGTYAGNDAIVAFARMHNANVVIHQLASPVWTIRGSDDPAFKELHISYHNGDHYSSVRKIGDHTDEPACVWLKYKDAGSDEGTLSSSTSCRTFHQDTGCDSPIDASDKSAQCSNDEKEITDSIEGADEDCVDENDANLEMLIMQATGCTDMDLVQTTLEGCGHDVESAIDILLHLSTVVPDSVQEELLDGGVYLDGHHVNSCAANAKPHYSHQDYTPPPVLMTDSASHTSNVQGDSNKSFSALSGKPVHRKGSARLQRLADKDKNGRGKLCSSFPVNYNENDDLMKEVGALQI